MLLTTFVCERCHATLIHPSDLGAAVAVEARVNPVLPVTAVVEFMAWWLTNDSVSTYGTHKWVFVFKKVFISNWLKNMCTTGTLCETQIRSGNVNCLKTDQALTMTQNSTTGVATWKRAPGFDMTSPRSSHIILTVPQTFKSTCSQKLSPWNDFFLI